jgi:hypothetical protein
MLEMILSLFLFSKAPAVDPYTNVVETLRKIATANPATTQWIEIGTSDSGKPIVGLKIGDGPIADLVVGTHHGNEYGSTAVAMGTAEAFARDPIPGHTVYVIPVLNIAGYNSNNRYERTSSGSIDPNRDYPGPCGTSGPFKSKATRALADFIDRAQIVSSATLHTYAAAVLYPWGISTRDLSTPYDSTFIGLGKAAAVESGYEVGNSTELIYAADGAFEDYAFWKHGIWSLLFELGTSHTPSQNELKKMVAQNVPGLRRFLQTAPAERATDHDFHGRCDTRVQRRTVLE